jgi:phosphatidate cytidylyltransferase
LLKRDYGRKDSSDWMPGFGGVLDLIDSPLIAAPVAWALWEAGSLIAPSAAQIAAAGIR